MIIGVTGTIGSGKSTVATYLVKLAKAHYCDTDQYCKEMLGNGQAGWQGVVQTWGHRFLDDRGNIDRPLLRKAIFSDSGIRRALDQILHPLVREYVAKLKRTLKDPTNLLVVEVPLLFEVGWQNDFDKVLTVYATKEKCIKRVMDRDAVTRNEAEKAISTQLPLEEKVKRSDYVVDNSRSLSETYEQIEKILDSLKKIASEE